MQLVALIALAQWAGAIEVTTTPGQLSSLIEDTSIDSLTVGGQMDARDFQYIASELTSLTTLDLSGATIVGYSDPSQPLSGSLYAFESGTLPHTLLMGTRLEHIELPGSLVAIGYAALAGCDRLTSITLPPSVKRIGDYAFSGSALESIVIPATVDTVGRGAFAHCFALRQATIGASVVGDMAFVGDSALRNVQLGEGVHEIGTEAFHGTAIQSLDASQATALSSLGSWAAASTPLISVSLPQGMATMGEGALFGTTELSAIALPRALQQIPDYAFAGGSKIVADSILHEGISRIGDYAFYNWSDTRHFFLPSTLSYLGTRAMAGMTTLEQIDIAARQVPALGEDVWQGVDQPSVKLGTPDNAAAALYAAAEQWQRFYILHDYLLGDVNGDGTVDVSDINLMVNYILGKPVEPFIIQAADTDVSGSVDVTDINIVVNIVLGKVDEPTVRRINSHNPSNR